MSVVTIPDDQDKADRMQKDADNTKNQGFEKELSVRKKLTAFLFGKQKNKLPKYEILEKKQPWSLKLKSPGTKNEDSNSCGSNSFIRNSPCIRVGYRHKSNKKKYPDIDENTSVEPFGIEKENDVFSSYPGSSMSSSILDNSAKKFESEGNARKTSEKKIPQKMNQNLEFQLYPEYFLVIPLSKVIFHDSVFHSSDQYRYPSSTKSSVEPECPAEFSVESESSSKFSVESECPAESSIERESSAESSVETESSSEISLSMNLEIKSNVCHLVHDYLDTLNAGFYWGKLDRYGAEKLLQGKCDGTFLLRDSSQDGCLFTVTLRKNKCTLHARIEQYDNRYSFDAKNPRVFSSVTVCGLIDYYGNCNRMSQPMLKYPLQRSFTFSLQDICRAVIYHSYTYDGINALNLPKKLDVYLKEYNYKSKENIM